MQAKNREQYISEWRTHVNQLIHPFLDAGVQHSEFERVKGELMAVIEAAGHANFPGDKKDELMAMSAICDRAIALMPNLGPKLDLLMDLEHWHEQEPLDLDMLADFDDGEFLHDVGGIYQHFDRQNKARIGCFQPRCAK